MISIIKLSQYKQLKNKTISKMFKFKSNITLLYKILKNFYFIKKKKKNTLFFTDSYELLNFYISNSAYTDLPLNISLKKWFFLKYMISQNYLTNYARKLKLFNKSRYSRNRQNVRVTFYFSLYVNIVIVFLVFSVFYNLSFFMTYNWWFYFVFYLSFIYGQFFQIYKK